jgi:hypothetical protein
MPSHPSPSTLLLPSPELTISPDSTESPIYTELLRTSYASETTTIRTAIAGSRIASTLDGTLGIGVSFVDLNTVAGSSDTFRNAVGGYFYNDYDSFGNLEVPPSFYKFIPTDNPNPYIHSVHSVHSSDVNESAAPVARVGGTDETDVFSRGYGASTAGYQNIVLPFVEFVVAVEGDPDAEYLKDVMSGNKYWQLLFTGGSYLYDEIKPIWNAGVYDDHFMITTVPYQNIQKQYLVDPDAITNYIGATYDYNHYLPNYQNFANQVNNELLLPNWYTTNLVAECPSRRTISAKLKPSSIGSMKVSSEMDPSVLNPNIADYYTFGQTIPIEKTSDLLQWPPISDAIVDDEGPTPEPPSYLTPSWTIPYSVFLNERFSAGMSYVSASSIKYITSRYRNILFNDSATTQFLKTNESDGSKNPNLSGMLPYYNRITFPTLQSGPYSLIIADNDYSTFLLRTLKETFLEQNTERLSLDSMQFLRNDLFLSASASRNKDEKESTSNVQEYRCVDFIKMLMYSYHTIYDDYQDFFVMDYESIDTMAAYDTEGVYRAYNTKNVVKTMNSVLRSIAPATSRFEINSIFKILNSQNPVSPITIEDPSDIRPETKMNEVIAYRVEKIGGPVSGDSNAQSVLQNFWIFNNPDLDDLDLIDAQVKYDTNYTYNIYAYYVVGGFKYKYSDLRLSKIIGQVNDEGYSGPIELGTGIETVAAEPPKAYCIEYYDPFTGKRLSDLLENIVYGESSEIDISRVATDAQRIAVSSKYEGAEGDPDNKVMPPYKAQFLVTCQPSIKLVEVPLLRKTYKILDQPPNRVNVVPSHILGNSNQLSFDIFYQTKSPEVYPRSILNSDDLVKEEFLNANDTLATTAIVKPSTSPQAFIEVYKLATKPKSFRDFSGNFLRSIPLGIENTDFSYTTAVFNDIVKSNHKYYYLFRSRSRNNIAGTVDTIIEAQLVNDGGYKYANFEVLFEQDLEVEEYRQASKQFKNLFQLTPNLSQTTLVDKEANFNLSANSNYNRVRVGAADDLIWDKTFKIRLTSKKTGKKIDLNITYSDPDANLEED